MGSNDQAGEAGLVTRVPGRLSGRGPASPRPEAEARLPFSPEVLLDTLPDGAALATASGRIDWVNASFARLLGRPGDELIGQSLGLIAGPYAGEREGLLILELARAGEGELEVTAISREGTSVPCLLRVRAMGEGPEAARLVVLSETTELSAMRAEMAAKAELQQRERSILENIARSLEDGLVVLDDSERVVLVNASAQALLGLADGAQRGRALMELPLPGPLRGEWLAFLASNEASSIQTLTLHGEEGARVLLLQFGRAAARGGVPLGSVLLMRDLSVIGRAERARTGAMRALTHELRSPMQTIRGFAETLAEDDDLPDETRREFCRTIEAETRRLGHAVETLLALAGRGSVSTIATRRTHDLRSVVSEGVEAALSTLSRPAGEVSVHLPDEPLPAWVDAERLTRVVQELTTNALRHGASTAGVEVRARPSADDLLVEVRDRGPGVAPEELETIFDPFYRLSSGPLASQPPSEALAFGLPFCRHVVEAHGGAIRAELPRGGGLRILLEIPRGRR